MAASGTRKYTHTPAALASVLRGMPAFSHLRGQLVSLVAEVADRGAWTPAERTTYDNAWPLFSREQTILWGAHVWDRRKRLVNPREAIRRLAFKHGVTCRECGDVSYFLRCLPATDQDPFTEALRVPFDSVEFSDAIEPLCPICRASFHAWVQKYAGQHATDEQIDVCASGWVASRVVLSVNKARLAS
jgi:hypothetical protein